MKLTFDVSATEFATIRDILLDTLPPDCRVWVFGSRAKNTARFNSDLDLAIEASQGRALPTDTLPRLKDAFNDAPLSYRVDVLDLTEVSDDFKAIIRKQAVAFPLPQTDNAPKIRFPEFSKPWATTPLKKIATFSKGKGISKNDIDPEGNTYCIRYGELYTTYDTIIDEPVSKTSVSSAALNFSEGGEVIVPASGEAAKDIATAAVVLRSGIALGGDLNIIRSPLNGAFLASYLSGKKRMALAAMAQGNSVVHLYPAQLGSLDIGVTCSEEQDKIAVFLGAADKKITQLNQKKSLLEDYKEGCMQRLFSQEVRFQNDYGKDFPGWEEKRVSEVFTITRGHVLAVPKMTQLPVENSNYPVYSSQTRNKGLTGYYSDYLFKDAITWTTDGANAGDVQYRSSKFYCTNVCGVLLSKDGFANSCIAEMLNRVTKRYVSYVGNPKLMNNVMGGIKMDFPHPDEQRKIADFLSAIDTKIDLVGQELGHAQAFKKGLLQQMFV